MSDIFISYSRRDEEYIGKIFKAVTTAGFEVWIDWDDIPTFPRGEGVALSWSKWAGG